MSLTNSTRLESIDTSAEVSGATVVLNAETGVSLAAETPIPAEGDWTYSATAEGRTGEVAVITNGVSNDFDDAAGFIYSGNNGGAARVKISNLDLTANAITGPTEGETYAVALMKNNDVVAFTDEGYQDGADLAATEQNLDTYVGGLISGDVLRVAILSKEGNADIEADIDVAEGGAILIV